MRHVRGWWRGGDEDGALRGGEMEGLMAGNETTGDRARYADNWAVELLCRITAPTVIAAVDLNGLAGVLYTHGARVTSYDGYHLEGCDCDEWEPEVGDWKTDAEYFERTWGAFYAHQAEAVKAWLQNRTKGA